MEEKGQIVQTTLYNSDVIYSSAMSPLPPPLFMLTSHPLLFNSGKINYEIEIASFK